MFAALALAVVQLFWIQGINAADLSAQSADQRATTVTLHAVRGQIADRNGKVLAFTMQARALTVRPLVVRKQLQQAHERDPKNAPTVQAELDAIAAEINKRLGKAAPVAELLRKLHSNETFEYLVRRVDAGVAAEIKAKFPLEVGVDRDYVREYPGGSLAANVLGAAGWDGHGLMGLELALDAKLAGRDGSETYDRSSDGIEIAGSRRDRQPAVDGADVQLTLDSDLQYYVQQQVQQAKEMSLADDAQAVVLDAKTGQVLAMANDNTFNPSRGPKYFDVGVNGNPTTTSPFEPGSVNKVVTAASLMEYHLAAPDEVLQVPGRIDMGGVTVHDAWDHGVAPYTVTGVFGMSSNVGTLMLAQRVGAARYADMLRRFGIGRRTGIGLPGESSGELPPRSQWSDSTFANLPIGQGLSMTLLQMTSMYQAIANDGVRMPPRIIASVTGRDGKQVPAPMPEGVRVVSPTAARAVREMFQAVTQRDPMGVQTGTGPSAAIAGYPIAGKTGTAQKVDEHCHCYSNSNYWITFAGIAPADNPRFVVGIMLNAPQRSSDGSGGMSAAPLFHNIASWLLQRDGVPLSPNPPKRLVLEQR
ncbi:MAG: penicillin-binding protein 2 [Mycobacteriaceae bacterium]|nr:penicillin-binding protein 2 [Mycobacteriaceae bacterium]